MSSTDHDGPAQENVYYRVIQFTPSEDGRACGIKLPTDDLTWHCDKQAAARVSYGLWASRDVPYPAGVPNPSTLFVGACEDHLEDLRQVVGSRGGEMEMLG